MPLPSTHLALALLIVAIWGTNFVVIHEALEALPPLFFAALRFAFAFLPAAFFIKRPDVAWRNLAAYGLLIGVGQFGVLFIAMDGHISPGMASLVIQMQVFFTIALSMLLTGETMRIAQAIALALAAGGIAIIGMNTDGDATFLGLGLVLVAAASWAGANIIARASVGANMLGYIVWSSLVPAPVLLGLSLVFEGSEAIALGIGAADVTTWAAVGWQSVGNTLIGFGIWAWLLARHPAATITPIALLVPVFGMGASALILGEPMQTWKILAASMVLAGLGLGFVAAKRPLLARPRSPA